MKSCIVIVSVSTGDPELFNLKTTSMLRSGFPLVLRTGRHPVTSWLKDNRIEFTTLDHFYEESDDFDLLNKHIAEHMIRMASGCTVVYAISDPLTDQSVRTIIRLKPADVSVDIVPGLSTYDQHLSSALEMLPDGAVLTISASRLTEDFEYDPNFSLLITELDNQILTGQVKLMLSGMLDDEYPVLLLRGDGKPVRLPLWQLDRHPEIDHRSAVLVPCSGMFERRHFVMKDLMSLMERLRSSDGCPWDRIQTHESLRPYLIEEAWECVASIDQQDTDHLCEELGDLLFQVAFHSSIGRSFDEFTIQDVLSSICLKMIRRHPHVFGTEDIRDPETVRASWEKNKQKETGHMSAVSSLDDVSPGLPSLKYASKMLRKLSGTPALQNDTAPVLGTISSMISGLKADSSQLTSENLGRLLLLCTELCCVQGHDGELILHQAADKMKNRLKSAEKTIIQDGKSLEHLTFDELGVYLNHVEGEIE